MVRKLAATDRSIFRPPIHGLSYVVYIYSLLAVIALGVFGSLHLVNGNSSLGYFEIAGSAAILANLGIQALTGNVTLTKNIYLLILLVFLGVMLVSGGTEQTGIFWFFTFPVTAFFLAGTRQGLWWMACLSVVAVGIWVLAMTQLITIPYDSITLRQLLASILAVSGGIYAYQRSREHLEQQTLEGSRALHNEKVRTDDIVKHIAEGIITTDAEGQITYLNQAAEKLLGKPATDLLGKKFFDAVPVTDQTGTAMSPENNPLQHSLQTGKSLNAITWYQRRSGQIVPLSVASTAITVDGQVVGAIGTLRDVSEEQQMARAKSEFVTLASHQLRTPISAISWVSELLLSGDAGKLDAEVYEHIENIYHSNQRMASLVSEMLTVSSLELNTLPIMPEPINLGQLAADIVQEQLAARNELGRSVAIQCAANVPPVPCDPEAIKLLMRNVLTNALKYTPKKGQINIKIRLSHSRRLHASSKGSVMIAVSDTGYGIPPQAADKIFTKFFRAPNILQKDTDGTGLGLFVVKALLDYVGGDISFVSAEGKGTTFTIVLPLEGMSPHKPQAVAVGRSAPQSGAKGRAT